MSLCACGCGQTTPTWRKNDHTKGRVRGEHMKYLPGHRNRVSTAKDPSTRFWAKVRSADADACWIWQGHLMPNGYGTFASNAKGRKVLAHRYAYEELIAPIPGGLTIDHLCRTTACVNPWHMEPVPRAINLARDREARRHEGAAR